MAGIMRLRLSPAAGNVRDTRGTIPASQIKTTSAGAEFPFQKSLGGMSTVMMGGGGAGFRAGNTLHSDNPLWHSSLPKWPALPNSALSSRGLTFPHPVASRDYLVALENLRLRHLLIPLGTFH